MILYIIIQDGNLLITKKLNPLYTKFTNFDLQKCDMIIMGNIKNTYILSELENKHEAISYSNNNISWVKSFLKRNL